MTHETVISTFVVLILAVLVREWMMMTPTPESSEQSLGEEKMTSSEPPPACVMTTKYTTAELTERLVTQGVFAARFTCWTEELAETMQNVTREFFAEPKKVREIQAKNGSLGATFYSGLTQECLLKENGVADKYEALFWRNLTKNTPPAYRAIWEALNTAGEALCNKSGVPFANNTARMALYHYPGNSTFSSENYRDRGHSVLNAWGIIVPLTIEVAGIVFTDRFGDYHGLPMPTKDTVWVVPGAMLSEFHPKMWQPKYTVSSMMDTYDLYYSIYTVGPPELYRLASGVTASTAYFGKLIDEQKDTSCKHIRL